MRYAPGHKEQTRTKLLSTAGSMAKTNGFGATGVDGYMAAAGLTSGAFYAHFPSKAEFLTAIVEHELARSHSAFADKTKAEFMQAIAFYLSAQHVEHPETGCVLPSLTPEIARSGTAPREAFEETVLKIRDIAKSYVTDESAAWPMVCQLVGAVMIARAMKSDASRQSLLSDVEKQCKELVR